MKFISRIVYCTSLKIQRQVFQCMLLLMKPGRATSVMNLKLMLIQLVGPSKTKEVYPIQKHISRTFSVSCLALILSVIAIALLIVWFIKASASESSENSNSISVVEAKLQNLSNILTELSYQFQQQNYINDALTTLLNLCSCADIPPLLLAII